MTARPALFPEWATNANFSTGPQSGQPTKIAPDAGLLADGNIRATAPPPQKFNYWQNQVATWLHYLEEIATQQVFQDTAPYAANTNNANPGTDFYFGAVTWRIRATVAVDVTGIVAPSGPERSLLRYIVNAGSFSITLKNQSASSTAANRFAVSTGADHVLTAGSGAWVFYDTTSDRWVLQAPGAGGGGGTVDFASVSAALAAATGNVSMNDQGFIDVAVVKFATLYGLNLELDGVTGGPVIGTGVSFPNHLYLRTPSGGRWGVQSFGYTWHFYVGDDGTISAGNNRVQDVGAPLGSNDAVNLSTLDGRGSNSHGVAVATAVPGTPPVSGSFSRADHVHAIPASVIQAAVGTVVSATSFNNQNITNVNQISATQYIVNGVAVVAEGSGGSLIIGNAAVNATLRASTLLQIQIGVGSPQFAVRSGYVGINTQAFAFESGVAGPYMTQQALGAGVHGGPVKYLGQFGGSGSGKGGQALVANGRPFGAALQTGAAVGLFDAAAVFLPMVEVAEVGAGKRLTALGPHTAIGAETDPGDMVFQVPVGGAFGASNPPSGQLYVRFTATSIQIKDSAGTVTTLT